MECMRAFFLVVTISTAVSAAGIDEVNLFRTTHGLRPFKHDPQLTAFAQMKAEYRAARMLKNGHQGPAHPPGTGEGTAEAMAMWGWLSCSMEEDWESAGAGVAIGGDGERYMVLVVRGGSGAATRGRNLRPVPTAHLTPDPPRFDRSGNRIGARIAQKAARVVALKPTNSTAATRAVNTTPSKPAAAQSLPLRAGQRDTDGAMIIRVSR